MDWQTIFGLLDQLEIADPRDPMMMSRLEAAEMCALLAERRFERDRRLRTLHVDTLRLVALDDSLPVVRAGGAEAERSATDTAPVLVGRGLCPYPVQV